MRKQITATIPNLGTYTVNFHNESAKIINSFGEEELSRLSRIPHLGTAVVNFTGINHSRLEYLLLECSITELLRKFNQTSNHFSFSGSVNTQFSRHRFSSGEELIKTWFILSNFGHLQYTYGTEKAFFTYLRENSSCKKNFLSLIKDPQLRRWSASVISQYRDTEFHWVLSIIRVLQKVKSNYVKGLCFTALKIYLIPLNQIVFTTYSDKYKIYRLRKIYERIRLLSLVTLDSYYSHQPIRYQLSTAIMDLGNLFSEEETEFEKLLKMTGKWLANEVYLHPQSSATLIEYEAASIQKIRKWYKNKFNSLEDLHEYIQNLMSNGFGQPKQSRYQLLLRAKISKHQNSYLKRRDMFEIRKLLEKSVKNKNFTPISVIKNPFNEQIYIDIFYDKKLSKIEDIGRICCGTYVLLSKSIHDHVDEELNRYETLFASLDDTDSFETDQYKKLRNEIYKDSFAREVREFSNIFFHLIQGVINYILSVEYYGFIDTYIPSAEASSQFLIDYNYRDLYFSTRKDALETILKSNPNKFTPDRLHEIAATNYHCNHSRFPLIISCVESYKVLNHKGTCIDEWDGFTLEISNDKAFFTIIESKNMRSHNSSETKSFKQLETSIKMLKSCKKFRYRRKRIPRFGAKLTISLV